MAQPPDKRLVTEAAQTTALLGVSEAARARSSHTGQQTSSTISDLIEAVQDIVGAMVTTGGGLSFNYDDTLGKATFTATGVDAEAMRDQLGVALVGVNGVTIAPNDEGDTIVVGISGLSISQITGLQTVLNDLAATVAAHELDLDQKAALNHTHHSLYWKLADGHLPYRWVVGDPAPPWLGNRPAGMFAILILDDASQQPSWATSVDIPLIRTPLTVPSIRSVGSRQEEIANVGRIIVTSPADTVAGDSLWAVISANATTAVPAGWTLVAERINVGAGNSCSVFSKIASTADIGAATTFTFGGSTAADGIIFAWQGAVNVNTAVSSEQATDAQTHVLPAITPTAESTVVGISGVRYSIVAGDEDTLARTGWTEIWDNESKKSGAPNRGVYVATYNAGGAAGVAVASTSASTAPIPVQTTSHVFAVVKA